MAFMLADRGHQSIVSTIPSFLAVVFVVVCAGGVELRGWLRSASKLKLWGVEIERASTDLKKASPGTAPTEAGVRRAVERLTESAARLAGMSILWVDDHPENNKQLRTFISKYGQRFVLASSNPAARTELKRVDYSLVITDIARAMKRRRACNSWKRL